MGVIVEYYLDSRNQNPVKKFINSLPVKTRVKIRRIFFLFEEYGIISVIPHIKKVIGTQFWEIRVLGKDSIRILYFMPIKDKVLVLHGFKKKTQKTPEKELNTALIRYKDWMSKNH